MKKLPIAVAAVAAVVLVGPFACGQFAERRANALLDAGLEQLPWLVVTERSWDRGWFTSQQTLTVRAALPGESGAAGQFTVHNAMLHGPVLGLSGLGAARVRTTVDLPEELRAKIRATFGEESALYVVTRIGFLGGGSTKLRSEGRTLTVEDDATQISYETATAELDFSGDFRKSSFDGRLPRVEIRGADGGLAVMEGITLDGSSKRLKGFDYLSDGEFALRVAKLEASSATGSFKSEKLHYEGEVDVDDGLVAVQLKIGSGKVEAAQLESLDLDVRETHYDFTLRRLHAESVDAFYRSMQEAYRGAAAAQAGEVSLLEDEAAMRLGFIEPLKEQAANLLAHDPELSFDRVGFRTPEGELVLKGVLRVVGLTLEELQVAGLGALVSRLQADITCELSQPLVEKFPNGATVVGAGLDNGFLKREGGKLVARIEYGEGRLRINGKEQPLPMGMGLSGPGAGGAPPPGPPEFPGGI